MQFALSASTFLALVASTLALQVTAPAEGSTLDLSKDNTIEWTSVSTDPQTFDIVLTNMNLNPSVRITIAEGVQTSAGSYDVSAISDAAPGGNYRINFESNTPNNQGILAQSGQFNVAEAGSSSTSLVSFSSSTPSTSAMASTSTMTSTISSNGSMTTMTSTGTSTATESASATSDASSSASSSASGTASGAPASFTGGASTLNTFAGAGVLAMVAALFA